MVKFDTPVEECPKCKSRDMRYSKGTSFCNNCDWHGWYEFEKKRPSRRI